MLKIGTLALDGNLILSPMAGYTDVAMRVLCRKAGAALVCSEMVHASAVKHDNPKTKRMMDVAREERPTCIQLFGKDPQEVAASCAKIEKLCDIIGFNFGCPAQQIRVSGCGAVLLDDPDLIETLVGALRQATDKPLLMKMRLGNDERADFVDIAQRMEYAGADAIIVHGRTAREAYRGHADWHAIAQVKEALDIPVIANGDVIDGKSAKECLSVTKADGVAVGRAALGDPDIFRRIKTYLKTGKEPAPPTPVEKMKMFNNYALLARAADIPKQQILQQAMVFTKGLPGAARMREALQKTA